MTIESKKDIDIDKVALALSLNQKKVIASDSCPNEFCGYKGTFRKERRGYLLLMFFLFLFGVIPGLFYWIAHRGYDYFCPKCNAKINK